MEENQVRAKINNDVWIPACGGSEKPFNIKGYRLWYMWNIRTGEHAYLNCDTDVFLTKEELVEIFC